MLPSPLLRRRISLILLVARCYDSNRCRSTGQTDGRTDTRPLHRPFTEYYSGSINYVFLVKFPVIVVDYVATGLVNRDEYKHRLKYRYRQSTPS